MSRIAALALSVAAAAFGAEAAAAVSLTNRDERDHKVTIVEGQSSQDHTLAPSAVLEGICPKGCVIRLNDSESDEYELEGNEIVSIEEGYLYYDGPDAPADPVPGEAGEGARK
ncbi:MAG: hypothetical protein KJZ80_16295 [Hyphomicrobiaceae bacterium]|nr:hypothetical protein [Hyphomicrobiaceae bacterium]